jgi:hypothetical protein
MGWSYDEVLDLPCHVYDILVEEINKQSESD